MNVFSNKGDTLLKQDIVMYGDICFLLTKLMGLFFNACTLMKMKILFFLVFIVVFPVQALVLDWSGSYEVEISALQNTDDFDVGVQNVFHNLHLKPHIHAFDGVKVQSWFHLSDLPDADSRFYPQEGIAFGTSPRSLFTEKNHLGLFVRSLFLELSRDFVQFQVGWKPHHFGMGMYYNDSSEPFSPVYSLNGSRGFASLKLLTKSFYIKPLLYLDHSSLLNLLIQGGFETDSYGVEGVYKKGFLEIGLQKDEYVGSSDYGNSDYLGLYAYYKMDLLQIQLEFGTLLDDSTYGGTLNVESVSPWEWLNFQLNAGISTVYENQTFYFDPTFSSDLSFAITEYEGLKSPEPEYLKEYLSYSFHSAFYVAPSLRFLPVEKIILDAVFPVHISTTEMELLVFGVELLCTYQWADNITWSSGIAAVFPEEDIWHIGVVSQAAITF